MIIFTSAAKFKFQTIVSYSTLGIGLYLFYRKNVIAQFQNKNKNDRSPLCAKDTHAMLRDDR